MGDLPNHYQLKSEEKDHFVIHDARDKKEFKIAKKGIHPAHQLNILRLQKFSEGGEAKDDTPDYIKKTLKNSEDPVIGSWGRMDDNKNSMDTTLETLGIDPDEANYREANAQDQREHEQRGIFGQQQEAAPPERAPVPSSPQLAPTPVAQEAQAPGQQDAQSAAFAKLNAPPAQAPQGGSAAMIDPATGMPSLAGMVKSQNQYEGAINAGARGEMALNQENARMWGQHAAFQKMAADEVAESTRDRIAKLDKLADDISKKEIDPQHYWSTRDSHAKMRAGIGILLSGMSGAQNNMAMDVINKNIDRDIDAQKANLGKKQTLLSDNLKILGEKTAAESATRAQYEAVFQGQLAQTAAKMGSPMIQARAAQLIQESRAKQMALMQPVAQQEMARKMLSGQGGTSSTVNDSPIDFQRLTGLKLSGAINPKEEEDATKEANHLSEVRSMRKAWDTTFNEMNQKFLAGNLTPGQVDAAKWTLAGKLQHASAGRFNLEDAKKQVEAMSPGMGDLGSTRAFRQEKSDALFDTMEAGTTTLDRLGLKKPYVRPNANEGKVASDAKGNKLIMQNGKWVPYRG